MFDSYFEQFTQIGVLSKAFAKDYELIPVPIPSYSPKGFKGVDARPYGGGEGVVMRADVLEGALLDGVVKAGDYASVQELHIVCPAPRGRAWDLNSAKEFALKLQEKKDIVFICGRYEGIDERFLEAYVDEFISLGDYILTGGELATMVILDSSFRYIPKVLGNSDSYKNESFEQGTLEQALYTRPAIACGLEVPKVYMGGNHSDIEKAKADGKKQMTNKFRKDLNE